MRKVMDGAVYDTSCAVIDKKFTSGVPGDPYGYEETLYITKDGLYFIYTNGGYKSKYPRESITPIDKADVRAWVLSR
ncbi:MAG: hypothetical protein LUD50_07330 [Clostridia bacterium]|nr:hypothetical protein [Clostridia bacterium]